MAGGDGFFTLDATFMDDGALAALSDIPQVLDKSLQMAIAFLAPKLKDHLQTTAPVDTNDPDAGELRDSIDYTLGDMDATFFGVFYALYVIGGTAPHQIWPRNAPYLRFFWERVGEQVSFAHVNHPGTFPNDFRVPALALLQPEVNEAIEMIWVAVKGAW